MVYPRGQDDLRSLDTPFTVHLLADGRAVCQSTTAWHGDGSGSGAPPCYHSTHQLKMFSRNQHQLEYRMKALCSPSVLPIYVSESPTPLNP